MAKTPKPTVDVTVSVTVAGLSVYGGQTKMLIQQGMTKIPDDALSSLVRGAVLKLIPFMGVQDMAKLRERLNQQIDIAYPKEN